VRGSSAALLCLGRLPCVLEQVSRTAGNSRRCVDCMISTSLLSIAATCLPTVMLAQQIAQVTKLACNLSILLRKQHKY
jgi:hypothetical protein